MRYGFTTGSCAAAAAKAAAYMLLSGKRKEEITIETPKGILFPARILEIRRDEKEVSCGVRKDGGDDPDITTGLQVRATVRLDQPEAKKEQKSKKQKTQEERSKSIQITAGEGVGHVTKPGLDQPVGEAAINRVPRRMIQKEVTEVMDLFDYEGCLLVEISIPGGEKVAEQTFNPRLGIVGGLSILGTTGIVEPMSSQALLDTIRVELRVKSAQGQRNVAVTPGNYGQDYMRKAYGYDLDRSVKCSNFIGDTIDLCVECGMEAMLLTGHIGKLVKVAGGMMNTHSREGDCRMELLTCAALQAGIGSSTAVEILKAATTEEGVHLLDQCGKRQETMAILVDKIQDHLKKRAAGRIQIECIVYATAYGELGKSSGATDLLQKIMEQEKALEQKTTLEQEKELEQEIRK